MRFRSAASIVLSSFLLPASAALAQGAPPLLWTKGGHLGVKSVALSPDRSTLASIGTNDDSVKLWNAGDASLVRTLTSHLAPGEAVPLSARGQCPGCGG